MRYVLDFVNSENEMMELSFQKNNVGSFIVKLTNIQTLEELDLILDVDDLKSLNGLSFKCRKEAEKDLREFNLDGSKKKEVNNG